MRSVTPIAIMFVMAARLCAQPPVPAAPPPEPASGDSGSIARKFADLIPDLIRSLQDTDAQVRQHAAMALATLGPEALKPVTEALHDPINEKRAAAAYALGQMGYEGREAMPALQKALKDEDAAVRRAASQAISRILSDELNEPSHPSSRYRGRNYSTLPKLTVPGTQTGPLPPLDPVPNTNPSKSDRNEKREPTK